MSLPIGRGHPIGRWEFGPPVGSWPLVLLLADIVNTVTHDIFTHAQCACAAAGIACRLDSDIVLSCLSLVSDIVLYVAVLICYVVCSVWLLYSSVTNRSKRLSVTTFPIPLSLRPCKLSLGTKEKNCTQNCRFWVQFFSAYTV